jgi:hypothetical protein
MLILLVWKPEAASADKIERAADYFRARIRTELGRYTCACGTRGARFTPLLSIPAPNAPTISIFEHEHAEDATARHRDGIDAARRAPHA